ncbi:glycosyltransferase family 25 protein [Holospora curviuscula]|uniref:Glycosyltransferase family 25 (LPS biosynthesis protein) n=1 Tax=Holospora curviuscula TaxID=1082868 RepID=A0A2S5REQ2_9PROT|nr:glycosyltransferase family 25 protein [Holospora curviuscula]PPE05615.1 Glycosyltransferase family 25 (LPS biosynthesis protein) [Holospora curviuscula]
MINTYIINLDRGKERWERMMLQLAQFSTFHIQRISGVDGKHENISHIRVNSKKSIQYFGQPLSVGTIGCYLGHVRAWEMFCHSQHAYGLILEDDALFNPPLLLYVLNRLGALHTSSFEKKERVDWDICSFQLNHRGMPLPIGHFEKGYQLCTYLTSVTGAGAYVLTKRGAHGLLSKAFPIVLPVDHYYTKSHQLNLRFVGVEPRIVTQASGLSFIEEIGREHLKILPPWRRVKCGLFRVKEEVRQALYNIRWAYPLYQQYRRSHQVF